VVSFSSGVAPALDRYCELFARLPAGDVKSVNSSGTKTTTAQAASDIAALKKRPASMPVSSTQTLTPLPVSGQLLAPTAAMP
jgi:hypothetical protein